MGQVLMGKMIRRAIERGYRRFDFLRGDEAYKATWTSARRVTWELAVFRPGARGLWLRSCRSLDQTRRDLRARVKQALHRRIGS